jgi:C1A family cysteine protease
LLAPSAAALPDHFDLRDYDGESYVTSVKSQQGGTCWTHGAMAAMEGNLMITAVWEDAGEGGEPNLAEYHLDWWNGFNQHNNDDVEPPYGGLEVHYGGDYRVTAAYLARLEGAVRDIDGQSFSTPPERSDPSYHYYYPRHIEWLQAGDNLEQIGQIKQRLMDCGVMGTCLMSSGDFIDSNYIHWQPETSDLDPNHAVAIVGWNDGLPTPAPQDGAWIIKNSWGTGWGWDGYFYISYYDKHCGHHPEMGAVSFREVEPLRYDGAYYHDYHGWRDEMEGVSRALNVFSAEDDHFLEAVSFFTPYDSLEYTVRVWDGFSEGQPTGELAELSGGFPHRGLHTVDLQDPVLLAEGDEFCLELQLSQPGMPYDRTSVVPVLLGADTRTLVESTASEGEGYYYESGQWKDLYYWEGNPYQGTGSFCIKGLVTDYGLCVEGDGSMRIEGPVGGPFLPDLAEFELLARSDGPLEYSAALEPAVGWINLFGNSQGVIYPYETESILLSVDGSASELSRGAYSTTLSITDLSEGTADLDIPVTLLVGDSLETVMYWSMDQDPGWEREGLWEYGRPQGQGGEHGNPDPSSGHTGTNVIGYNLEGDYENYLEGTYLTAGPLDCSEIYNPELSFQRWLNVQEHGFDQASVLVSAGDGEWITVWTNPGSAVTDSAWVEVGYDISGVAEGEDSVYVRWVMGPTNMGWTYSGWNIDDVAISGLEDLGPGDPLPAGIRLHQSRPNPMRSAADISYVMPGTDHLELSVYDVAGRRVRRLVDGTRTAGSHSLVWDGTTASGRRVPAGVYFVVAATSDSRDTMKLVRLD